MIYRHSPIGPGPPGRLSDPFSIEQISPLLAALSLLPQAVVGPKRASAPTEQERFISNRERINFLPKDLQGNSTLAEEAFFESLLPSADIRSR